MTGLLVHPEAEAEMNLAAEWYEKQERGLGTALVEEVLGVLGSIGEHPDQFPLVGDDLIIRRALLRRFPYAVWFGRESHDLVVVYAISHTKRRPGYWRVRARQT
jgi:hypothetical protein